MLFLSRLGLFAVVCTASALAEGNIVVANRGTRNLTVIDVGTDSVARTLPMPDNGEPMYVVYSPARNRFLVGDRANSRVVAFNARTFAVDGFVSACAGVFHMWADQAEQQLWVVCDSSNAVAVVDPVTLAQLRVLPMPEIDGRRPHDVILDPNGAFAYVTLTKAGASSYVVKFDTSTFAELGRREVGIDAHLGLARGSRKVYVPTQGSGLVYVLDDASLADAAAPIAVPGAHGAGMARNGQTFYTTNLPGGGVGGLVAIDTSADAVIGSVDTPPGAPIPVPHNIALTPNGRKLYVTHSGGAATAVTVYELRGSSKVPVFTTTVAAGTNPFGLAYVP